MSSRAGMIGSGSSSGNYKPSPTPTEQESMPTYINDELLTVGGIVNGILEGGAFPPQGEMPVRWREGMMMYFIEPLDDTYIKGEFKGQRIITSAGIWLYRRERWWKIIDDPSSIIGTVFAFRLTPDGNAPTTPDPSPLPPTGWTDVPPVKNDKSEWIWVTMSAAYDETTDEHTWTQPTPWSAGVIDGQDGTDGEEGLSNEQRFIAWGDINNPPVIADNTARNPETTGGFPFVLDIPATNPPTTVYIYTIIAKVGAETDTIRGTWSDPVLYSTPDTTQLKRAWATSANWGDPYPSFNPANTGLPGAGWSYTQPPYTRDYPIWMTERLEFLNNSPQTQWTTPVGWNSQDGADGAPGAPGEDGSDGINGFRGTVVLTDDVARSSWSSQAAYNLVVSAVSGDPDAKNRVPLQGDVVTQQSDAAGFVQTRRYVGNSGNPGTWQVLEVVIDGNAVVTGTLTGDALNANTQIRVGGNAGQDLVVLDANDANARLWVGSTGSSSANFAVDPSGNMYANNATFAGNISSTATITGGTLQSAQINSANGAFVVNSTGNMFATGGKIGALDIGANWLDVQTSTTGGMRVMNSGTSQAGVGVTTTSMQGGLSGTVRMWAGGSSPSANFQVSSTGDLYANNGFFGGTITAEGFTGAVGTAVDSVVGMQWLLTSASSNPITTIATITTPRQNYDRVASVTFTPAHVRKPVNANDDRFGVRYTALQGSGVNSSYRLLPVNSSGTYYSLFGNTYGSLDFLGSNSDNTIYSVTSSITWNIVIPATATTGSINIPLNVNLNQPSLPYPLGATAAPFTMDTGTVSVTIAKADSGILIN